VRPVPINLAKLKESVRKAARQTPVVSKINHKPVPPRQSTFNLAQLKERQRVAKVAATGTSTNQPITHPSDAVNDAPMPAPEKDAYMECVREIQLAHKQSRNKK
jgi:hypothetical protein